MTSKRSIPAASPNLTWPEIRANAAAFARNWAEVSSERAEAQTFWNEFFAVFGVQRRRVAVYEQRAERFGKTGHGRIDVFWPGTLLAEHKSAGHDLDAAFVQATGYFAGIAENELPRYVVVSDFQRLRLHDLDDGSVHTFVLRDFPKHIQLFGFIAGYARVRLREEPEANIRAVQTLGELHDALKHNAQIVYNNFPWPSLLPSPIGRGAGGEGAEHLAAPSSTEPSSGAVRHLLPEGEGSKHRAAIEAAAQAVLDARAAHPGATLAELYGADTMPPNLVRAHQVLDRAVDADYRADGGARSYAGDAERVAFLFRRYAELTSLLPANPSGSGAKPQTAIDKGLSP